MKINKFKKSWGNLAISGRNDNKEAWLSILKRYPLIICPHGGGLDPSPKAWEALCLGCIPIIKHSALDDIYSEFPVVFVDDWNEDTITMDNMKKWTIVEHQLLLMQISASMMQARIEWLVVLACHLFR